MKVGRNDPCPCGSGLKYKKCCADKKEATQEGTGASMGASSVLDEIREVLQGQNFASLEEAQAFASKFMQQRNQTAIDDFHGLSSGQMHRVLYFPYDSPELVTFPEPLDIAPEAPVIHLFKLLAEAIGEEGLKATATGNLPRNFCREAALSFFGEEKYRERTKYGAINKETDYRELHVMRVTCEIAGLVRKYKGKFILSRDCRKIMKEQGVAGVYPRLLRAFVREYNWGYTDRYPEIPFIQQSFLFSLYMLARYGSDWRPIGFYQDAFLRAFPNVLSQVPPSSYSTPEDDLTNCYSLRVIDRFALFFGLVEMKNTGTDRFGLRKEYDLRKLPLLDHAVRFHV